MALDCGMNVTEEIRRGGGGGGGGEGRGGESIRGSGNRDALRGGRRGSRKVSLPFHRRRIPTASRRQRGSAAELMDRVRVSCGWEGIVTSPSPRVASIGPRGVREMREEKGLPPAKGG